ncbi:DUF3800 domain-containing protein [Loktanella agnita]|uniref:DUF3800 domain-containing protein n=1 Tax=Loktanella agnita TaxID=287097 RepID=UPI003985C672
MKFNIYIDESGEAGIAKVRSTSSGGASPYFVMAGVVCQPTAEVLAKNAFRDAKDRIGKKSWKHATELGHSQKVFLARELNRLPVRFFTVVSNKATLGDYKIDINGNAHKFYNKCAQYLLENICTYLAPHVESDDDLAVYFEKMNHDYDAMRRFLGKVKSKPIYPQSKSLSILNPFGISTLKKGESEMLEISDFVAHAVFQCSNSTEANFNIPEPRYFVELSSRFAGDENGCPIGSGIKFIHDIGMMRFEPAIEKMFSDARVQPPRIG